MSTDDDLARARTRHHSLLPADPSEDELARHWTLTSDDLAEIAQCRGADHRRRFALQLCTLRAGSRFASIVNGRLKLKKRDALAISRAVRELRATIGASLPRVRIEDLLQDVDEWCRFTNAFQPLGGYLPRGADLHRSLLATVIAHGTNLGLAAMSQSVDTLTAEILQDTSRWLGGRLSRIESSSSRFAASVIPRWIKWPA